MLSIYISLFLEYFYITVNRHHVFLSAFRFNISAIFYTVTLTGLQIRFLVIHFNSDDWLPCATEI